MITILDAPENVAAFQAKNKITVEDYNNVVMPAIENAIKKNGVLNYVMFIDTDISDFSVGAWLQDSLIAIKEIGKWHKAAIVSNSDVAKVFTAIFNIVIPGQFKSFDKDELTDAIKWASE